MPGKQDCDYFPLNLNNMNGGLGFYGEVGPILIPSHRHHGKFDASAVVHHGSPIAMALHNSPVNATIMSDNLMSEYINMNVNSLPPVNSEDEEEDDDIVSQSGSESVSVQGSDLDLDVEVMDDVDSLVLNIRDKLRMAAAPQFNIHGSHSAGEYCWTDSPSATSTPNSIHSTASNNDHDLLILPQQRSSSSTNNSAKGSGQRKRRTSLNRSNNSQHWRHSHPNSNNSYYKQFHHQSGSISKSNKKNNYQNQWWSTRSFGDLSKQSRSKDAYHLLQELIQSGSLIKEAVRRLNIKCLSSSSSHNNPSTINNGSSNNSSTCSSNHHQDPSNNPPNNATNTASLVVSTAKFSYMNEESENNFHPHPSSHQRSAHCN